MREAPAEVQRERPGKARVGECEVARRCDHFNNTTLPVHGLRAAGTIINRLTLVKHNFVLMHLCANAVVLRKDLMGLYMHCFPTNSSRTPTAEIHISHERPVANFKPPKTIRKAKKNIFQVCYLAFRPLLCVQQCVAVCRTNVYVHWNQYTHAQPSPAPSHGTLAGSPYISSRERGGKVGSRFPAVPGVPTGQPADTDGCQPGSSRYALVGSDERLIG